MNAMREKSNYQMRLSAPSVASFPTLNKGMTPWIKGLKGSWQERQQGWGRGRWQDLQHLSGQELVKIQKDGSGVSRKIIH